MYAFDYISAKFPRSEDTFKVRSALWFMLFTGVIVHMLCCTSLYIAMTHMAKPHSHSESNKTFVPSCKRNMQLDFNITIQEAGPSNTRGDFEWDTTEVDILKSSFTWFMGPAQFLGGMLCQKYGGKITFGYSNLIMAILTFMIPFAAELGIKAVIIIRVLQGFAGGIAIGNSANSLISKWVPPDERGKFVTVMAGLYTGTAISYFLHGWVIRLFGWRVVFYVTSALTIFWCLIWHLVIYDSPQQHPYISSEELKYIEKQIGNSVSKKKLPIPWRAILTSRPVIVNTLCQMGSMWTIFTFTLYMPAYLTEIHGFEPHIMGMLSSLPYILETIFAVSFGCFTDYILHKKILSRTNTRKFATSFNTVVAGTLFALLVFGECDRVYIITLLALAVMLNGANLSGVGPNVIDLSPNFCAIIHGLQGFTSSCTGYISPLLIALITGKSRGIKQWNTVFLVTAGVNIIPGILFLSFSESEIQPWNYAIVHEEQTNEKLLQNIENGRPIVIESKK